MKMSEKVTSQTISDFGNQWTHFRDNDGYYGTVDFLSDYLEDLLPISDIEGARVGEIGSGTGRVVTMLLEAKAKEVIAIEPSEAFEVLKSNTKNRSDRITYIKGRGDEIPVNLDLDFIFSLGVLHHIPEPKPVVEAAYRALKPGGRLVVWLYGKEGNEKYLYLIEPFRKITKQMPHWTLNMLSFGLYLLLEIYIGLCKFFPLPLHRYCNQVLRKIGREKKDS
jgi:SAM-dependent methyltransferase